MRWCIDYRALNEKTVKDCYPLPILEDCMDTLQGTKYFSTLDMASGYYQIMIDKAERHKLLLLHAMACLSIRNWEWDYAMPQPLSKGQCNLYSEV